MKVHKGTSVAQAQQALEEARAAREKLAEEIAGLHGKRHQLAEDADAYEAGEAEIAKLQSEHHRLGLVVARRQEELEEAQKAAARSEWDAARKQLAAAYQPRRAASEKIASALEVLSAGVSELEAERARVKDLEAKFRALVPEDIDELEWPSGRDEAALPRLEEEIVEFVRKGALRPQADAADSTARWAEKRRKEQEERVPKMVELILRPREVSREKLKAAFAGLTEEERDKALRLAEASSGDVEKDVRDKYRHPLALERPDSAAANRDVERTLGLIRERIDRLRELAVEAEVAA
jgi:hypothetical protein